VIFQECFRYYKSKFSIILTVTLTLIVLASYYSTYLQKKEWEQVCQSGASDVNLEKDAEIISGYTGTYYFENFLFSSDFKVLAVIILLICFGTSIGPNMFNSLQSNYGTMVATRMSYKNYLFNVVMAQVLYISTFMFGYFLFIYVLSVFLLKGGIQISPNSIFSTISTLEYLSLTIISFIQMLIYIIVLIMITTVSPIILKNKYAIQILPFILVVFTYFLANVLGNISKDFAFLTSYIVLDNILSTVESSYNSTISLFASILAGSIFIIACIVICVLLYRANVKKFGQDYII